MNLTLATISLAANVLGGRTVTLAPSDPIAITQLCAGGCVQVDVGNVRLWPNGCMVFTPGLIAPGPFTCTDACENDHEDYCIVNGTHVGK